jgi:hypothetical protein
MQIDRSNYEICLIDLLDGNLNDIEVAQLRLFLQNNPDIKEEYDELTMFRLKSPDGPFHLKKNLKKTIAIIPESQFEYLCIASLENDLSAEQQAELKEIIEADPLKKITFDLIWKTKLFPFKDTFKNKKRLLRRTFAQNFIRISVIGLSAAALTALLIEIYVFKPEPPPVKMENTAQNEVQAGSVQVPSVTKIMEKELKGEKKNHVKKTNPDKLTGQIIQPIATSLPNLTAYTSQDSITQRPDTLNPAISKIPVSFPADLKGEILPNNLITLHQTLVFPPYDDGRSKLSRFIARTIREKILKQKSTKDSPLKGYEIAEAGVSGLNKLLGWEMALDEKKDDNGELKSVYFSSRLLKFNAPVKKSEPLQ